MFILSLLFAVLLVVSANAQPIPVTDLHINPTAIGGSVTDEFAVFAFDDQTVSITDATSIGDIGVGTTYVDYGHAVVTSLRDANNQVVTDNGGLGSEWTIWVEWQVFAYIDSETTTGSNTTYNVKYTGGTVNAYLATTDWSFGADQSPMDDAEPSVKALMMSFDVNPRTSFGYVIYDSGLDTLFRNAHLDLITTFVNDSILYSDSRDLSELTNLTLLVGIATESAASGLSNFDTCGGYVCVDASGTGSMQIAALPEPASIMMIGFGLLAIGVGIKRIK